MPAVKPALPVVRRDHPLAQGLVVAAALYEGAGLTANDTSGNNVNVTLAGTTLPSWVGGQSGWSLSFDGVSSYGNSASLTSNSPAFLNGAMTVACWVKFSDVTAARKNGLVINSKDGNVANFALVHAFSGQTVSFWNSAAGPALTSSSSITDTTSWHFIIATRDGASGNWSLTIDIDGKQDASGTSTVNPNDTSPILGLGRFGGFNGYYLAGALDGVVLWNRALALAERQALYADFYDLFRASSWSLNAAQAVSPAGPSFGWEGLDSPILQRIRRESRQVIPWE